MVTMTHKDTLLWPKIALYEPDIPQNTASIIRTCSCFGAILEIIEPCGFLFSDKRFKRVVLDYMEIDKIKFYKNTDDFFKSKINSRIILITNKAKDIYTKYTFKNTDTILFGRESAGVPDEIHRKINNKIKIPMIDGKRSLNLSTSVSIILAESIRQLSH